MMLSPRALFLESEAMLNHPEKYHVYHAIKLGNYNVGEKDHMMTLPLYMAIFL